MLRKPNLTKEKISNSVAKLGERPLSYKALATLYIGYHFHPAESPLVRAIEEKISQINPEDLAFLCKHLFAIASSKDTNWHLVENSLATFCLLTLMDQCGFESQLKSTFHNITRQNDLLTKELVIAQPLLDVFHFMLKLPHLSSQKPTQKAEFFMNIVMARSKAMNDMLSKNMQSEAYHQFQTNLYSLIRYNSQNSLARRIIKHSMQFWKTPFTGEVSSKSFAKRRVLLATLDYLNKIQPAENLLLTTQQNPLWDKSLSISKTKALVEEAQKCLVAEIEPISENEIQRIVDAYNEADAEDDIQAAERQQHAPQDPKSQANMPEVPELHEVPELPEIAEATQVPEAPEDSTTDNNATHNTDETAYSYFFIRMIFAIIFYSFSWIRSSIASIHEEALTYGQDGSRAINMQASSQARIQSTLSAVSTDTPEIKQNAAPPQTSTTVNDADKKQCNESLETELFFPLSGDENDSDDAPSPRPIK